MGCYRRHFMVIHENYMPDIFEAASDLEQLERDTIINQHRLRNTEAPDEVDGIRYCLDCGEIVPEARVIAVSAVRCIYCADIRERKLKQRGV